MGKFKWFSNEQPGKKMQKIEKDSETIWMINDVLCTF